MATLHSGAAPETRWIGVDVPVEAHERIIRVIVVVAAGPRDDNQRGDTETEHQRQADEGHDGWGSHFCKKKILQSHRAFLQFTLRKILFLDLIDIFCDSSNVHRVASSNKYVDYCKLRQELLYSIFNFLSNFFI